jgi:arabinosaccharide transport system substrate-binding protein
VGNLPTTLPSLAGKIKVMPLPAWERGGRRSSANGGTMIGVTKASKHPEVAWELAKFLYLSPVIARQLFDLTHIVSPVKSTWSASYYDRPEPYFCGQPVGRILQRAIPDIPPRPSSPYLSSAVQLVNSVISQLMTITDRQGYVRPEQAAADAQRLLDEAQHTLLDQIHRNVFQQAPATP